MGKAILVKSKKDIVERVAENCGLTKKAAETVVAEVFDEIIDTLRDGGEISISGFGKFEVKERAAREGINPATKEKIRIEASRTPGFKAAKALKDAVK